MRNFSLPLFISSFIMLQTFARPKNASCSIFHDENGTVENFYTAGVPRLFSSAGILRAVGVGGKSHPRDFGASVDDGLPNDHSRDTAAHGENTADQ